MPDNEDRYRQKYTQIQEIHGPDGLISGWYTATGITLKGEAGLLKRGTLLMSTADNEFAAATSAGVKTAPEAAVLCSDTELDGGSAGTTASAYFTGTVDGALLILPYETEEDVREDLIEDIKASLRRHGLMVL